ncbi:MAG: amidohydrolase family protein [Hymenobacter sp.]
MTTWAAHAAFEDQRKGQIKPGMLADFVVLKTDLMTAPNERLHDLNVQQTWIGGKQVFALKP